MYNGKKISAVVVAAGSSRRMGFDKLLQPMEGAPVVFHTVSLFQQAGQIDEIIVVGGDNLPALQSALAGLDKITAFVPGGATRAQSVRAGVLAASGDFVAIHDGARPFANQALLVRTLDAATQTNAAAPAVPVKDTIKQALGGLNSTITSTPPRSQLFAVQTPQVFARQLYLQAMDAVQDDTLTDDCALLERYGVPVTLVEGSYTNRKLTTPDDFPSAQAAPVLRVGHGYDVHRLANGRRLILGGVDIPYEKGLEGHSDADVLLHAVSDALLGAVAMGDIGRHFPDTNPAYAGADSLVLLEEVGRLLRHAGWQAANVDATLLCQRPRLAPHIPAMCRNIAAALGMAMDTVSVKATTEEGLGFTGQGLGIAAHAVVMVYRTGNGAVSQL